MRGKLGRDITIIGAGAMALGLFGVWLFPHCSANSQERARETTQEGGFVQRSVVNMADFASTESPTGGIQEAIDALPPNGGIVTIPPGEYLLRQSIRVGSNVTLQGAGGSTILRKGPQAESRLSAVAEQRSLSVQVENASGFRAGDAVGVIDSDSMGWNVGQTVVKGVQRNELLLERPLPRTYDPAKGGLVLNYFSAITATGASGITIKDLTIDGRVDENPGPTSRFPNRPPGRRSEVHFPFTFAAINLVDVTDSRIEGCQLRGWPSDGVSMQRGGGNLVTHCLVQNCRGMGFHPGGGLRDSVFSDNVARGNGGDGLYFCIKVQHVVVSNNVFIGNKGNGIGGLGDGGDKYNIVTNNVCAENGTNGILLWDGDNNTVTNNICVNNSQSAPGRYSGILLSKTAESIAAGNRCLDDQQTKTQAHGIQELANCRANLIANNLCRGNAQSGLALAGKESQQSGNIE